MSRVLRRTQSLCPVCLRRLDARYELAPDSRTVLLCKTCPDHGIFQTLIWREPEKGLDSVPAFAGWTQPKTPSFPHNPATARKEGCPFDCGLCPDHGQHTCIGLIEVTLRCNLRCPVCYAAAGADKLPPDPSLSDLAARLDALKQASGPCHIQISGGEATLREDLPEIVALARERGFALVQLNTNGLKLGEEPAYARQLKAAGLESVYLQWDAASDAACHPLRGRDCLDFKRRAVAHCAEAGLGVVLVATVLAGANDHELGDLLRLALSLGPAVRGLHLQPAAFFGRYPGELLDAPRLTLADLMNALVRQAPDLVRPEHLRPPHCEHELCSFSAAYRRTGSGGLEWLHPQAECHTGKPKLPGAILPLAAEGSQSAKRFLALHWKAAETGCCTGQDNPFLVQAGLDQHFTLSGMAFQDALSLDLDRVRGCCIHVVRADGRLLPFCLHNLTATGGERLYP